MFALNHGLAFVGSRRVVTPNRCRTRRVAPHVIAALAAVAWATSAGALQTSAGEAFGGGGARFLDTTLFEYFAFNVKQTGEDSAKGNIKYSVRDEEEGGVEFVSHLRANCIHFVDERTAIVACTVVDDTEPEFIGTTAVFTVRDNGQGPDAPPDEFSGVSYALDFFGNTEDQWTCESVLEWLDENGFTVDDFLTPFDPGNFHVRP